MAKVGVTITLKPLEGASSTATTSAGTYKGTYATTSGFAHLTPSSAFEMGRFVNPSSNLSHWKDDKYAQLVSTASTEPDAAKRQAIYNELNDYMLDQSVSAVLSSDPGQIIMSNKVRGVRRSTFGPLVYQEIWLAS
jgi:ABC-type transport system substrate-binding protein